MTLLSPLYLLGAAGVLAPLLIHLFGRRRPRRLQFPSLRLLRAAEQQRRSPIRLRRLLSLLMRMAAIVLLSLALARPVTHSRLLSWLAPDQMLHAIVLDVSASMNCRAPSGSFFDRGREAARQIAASIGPNAQVLLVAADSHVRPIGEGSVASSEAANLLEQLQPGEARGRLTDCIVQAVGLLEASRRQPGRLYLITDLQATSLAPLRRRISPRVGQVVVVDVGQEIESNAAVTDLRVEQRPALHGRPLKLRASVEAWGRPAGRPIPLTLSATPVPSVARGVSPRPGTPSFTEFELKPTQVGLLQGRVELPADAFPLDDNRLFAEHVVEFVEVLIVGDENESRYLRAALDPFPAGDERSVVRTARIELDALGERELGSFDVVVLTGSARLTPAAMEKLSYHIAAGAGALLFVGPRVELSGYNTGILPALSLHGVKLGAPVQLPDGLALADFEVSRPPLDAFASPLAGDLVAPRFAQARQLEVSVRSGVTVLARFEDGTPALVEAAYGRGRVILFNTAANAAWSDLVRRPVYVPLMHRLVYHLCRGRRPQVAVASPSEAVAGIMPTRVPQAQVKTASGELVPVTYRGPAWCLVPRHTGVYLVAAGGEEMAVFPVNLDPAESDPTRLTAADLRRRLAPLNVVLVKADKVAEFAQRAGPTPAEISALLALLALLVLAAESLYSLEPPRAESELPGVPTWRSRTRAYQ